MDVESFNDIDDDTAICPFCAEQIKKAAILCKHCHSELTKTENQDISSNNQNVTSSTMNQSTQNAVVSKFNTASEMKQCMFCHEEIKTGASICRFCNRLQHDVLLDPEYHDLSPLKQAIKAGDILSSISLLPREQTFTFQSEFDRRRRKISSAC